MCASSEPSASYGAIVDLRAGGLGSPSESSALCKRSLPEDDAPEMHAWNFLGILRIELRAYKKMANRDKKCDLLPLWDFRRPSV